MTDPITPTTLSGAPLPFVALPQTELLTIDEGDSAWLSGPLGEGIRIKPLRLDVEAGEWVVLAGFAPGSGVQLHYHTGVAEVFTLQGRWHYAEYPDQPQTAGSYLYEPAGSVHTLLVPEDNTEETIMFVRVEGANVNFDEHGRFETMLDAALLVTLTEMMAGSSDGAPTTYLRGGEVHTRTSS